nr:hypothetical protein [Vibrio splendidus]MCC4880853.1 hypothetical protein [Vibrio splendidus]
MALLLILSSVLAAGFVLSAPFSDYPVGEVKTIEGRLCWYLLDGNNKLQESLLLSKCDRIFISYRNEIVENLFRINFGDVPVVLSSYNEQLDYLTSGMNGKLSNRFDLTSISIMASFLSGELTRSRYAITVNRSNHSNEVTLSMKLNVIREMRLLAYKKSSLNGKMFDNAIKQIAGALKQTVSERAI